MKVETFRVGVVGHRAEALADADVTEICRSLERVLTTIRNFWVEKDASRALEILSSLAEGADRITAHVALKLNYQLTSPLPFPRDEFARDFKTNESKQEFFDLLEKATDVIEIEMSKSLTSRTNGYTAAADCLLAKSDLLIAIWDGNAGRGPGGTAASVAKAIAAGLAVLWISTQEPNRCRIAMNAPKNSCSPASAFTFTESDLPDVIRAWIKSQ